MARTVRKYNAIWNQLKQTGICKVAAPTRNHELIFKGVKKERFLDLGFRLTLSEQHKRAWIRMKSEGNLITFTIDYTIGLGDI